MDAVLSDMAFIETPVGELQNTSFSPVSKSNYIRWNDFEVRLCDENGTGIAIKTVSISLDGTVHEISTDENGTAICVQRLFIS